MDRVGVKNDNVCGFANGQFTPIWNAKTLGGKTTHFVDGFFKCEQIALAHKMAQNTGKTSKATWVRVGNIEDAI